MWCNLIKWGYTLFVYAVFSDISFPLRISSIICKSSCSCGTVNKSTAVK